MNAIDEEIRQALKEEDHKALEQLDDEAGLFDMLAMSFHGKQAWMTWYMWVMGFAAFAVGAYFFLQFLETTDVKAALGWSLGVTGCLFILAIIKVISWTQMQKLEVLREVKRLEARVMLALAEKNHS